MAGGIDRPTLGPGVPGVGPTIPVRSPEHRERHRRQPDQRPMAQRRKEKPGTADGDKSNKHPESPDGEEHRVDIIA